MRTLIAVLLGALVVACDEGERDNALARQDPEADGGAMAGEEPGDQDSSTPSIADAGAEDGGETVGDASERDGSSSTLRDGAVSDPGRVHRTDVTYREVMDTLITPTCLPCHQDKLTGYDQPALDALGPKGFNYFPGSRLIPHCRDYPTYLKPGEPAESYLLMVFRRASFSAEALEACAPHPALTTLPTSAQLDMFEDWIRELKP